MTVISATLHIELAQIVGHFEYYSATTKSKSVTGGCNIQCKQGRIWKNYCTLVFNRRSIDLSGAQEKEGHFHYKNFLRASK